MKYFLDIKPFQGTLNKGYCGPSSLKILLSYYGVKKSEEELAKLCGTTKELGTDDKRIKKAAEKLGFKVKIKNNSSFKDIEKWLKRKTPVIVDWFTKGGVSQTDSDVADGHYSVVMGIDDRFIYLQDPEIGKVRKLSKENFMSVWFDFKGKYIKPNELVIKQIIAIYK